jgi:sigma-E factor negative regulatory protein RseA
MSEKLRESLSAVMDGEADEFELRRVLDEVGRDDRLREQWVRYHVARAVLRREYREAHADLGARVWEAVTGEGSVASDVPVALAVPEPRVSPRTGRLVGMGVAAAVALAVVAGVNLWRDADPPVPAVAVANPMEGTIAGTIEGPVVRLGTEVTPVDLRRARAYMIHHVQHKAMTQPGVSSFAKMVAFETPPVAE